MNSSIQLVECPRDAMQGWAHPIATKDKVAYINCLLQVGFHTLDCLSFVSAKAIPQMADSHDVVKQMEKNGSTTKVLAIVLNKRGAEEAVAYDVIDVLGYPFSISPTFQKLNGNSTLSESWDRLMQIRDLGVAHKKQLCVYISMAFGNPYGDEYNAAVVTEWISKMESEGIGIISLADTVGIATAQQVKDLCSSVVPAFPNLVVGAHLHSTAQNWEDKMEAAVSAGIQRFDGALKGFGGCPMAKNELVGNMNTEWMIEWLEQRNLLEGLDHDQLAKAGAIAERIFNR